MDSAESDRRSDPSPKPVSKTLNGSSSGGRSDCPTLKKAQTEGRVIIYVDESACYLLPMLGLTWAPRGQTPILLEQAGREHLSLIAAIAPNGRIYVAGQDRAFNGDDIVWFVSKLCSRYRKRDLLLIWDGASIHRSEAVKAFLRARPGRVHLESLPPYSPELNPTELVWNQIKQGLKNRQGRLCGISFVGRLDRSRFRSNRHFGEGSQTGASLLPKKGDWLLYRLIHTSITSQLNYFVTLWKSVEVVTANTRQK